MANYYDLLHIRTDAFEMEGFCFGNGEKPLVILPGLGTKSIAKAAGSVSAAYSLLAKSYKIYVLDRRLVVPEGFSVREMAKDTAEAMRSLKIEKAAIFGASLGGMIAQQLAVDFPEFVGALALGSTTSRCNPTIRETALAWRNAALNKNISDLISSFLDALYSEKTVRIAGELIKQMNSDLSEDELNRFAAQAGAIIGFDIYDRLCEIKAPTIVIGVEGDKVVTGEASVEIAQAIGCELYMYGSEYAHCVFDEAPDYKNHLLKFFEGNTA